MFSDPHKTHKYRLCGQNLKHLMLDTVVHTVTITLQIVNEICLVTAVVHKAVKNTVLCEKWAHIHQTARRHPPEGSAAPRCPTSHLAYYGIFTGVKYGHSQHQQDSPYVHLILIMASSPGSITQTPPICCHPTKLQHIILVLFISASLSLGLSLYFPSPILAPFPFFSTNGTNSSSIYVSNSTIT